MLQTILNHIYIAKVITQTQNTKSFTKHYGKIFGKPIFPEIIITNLVDMIGTDS